MKRHLLGWAAILCCYFLGEWAVLFWHLPMPGALIGLLLLFLILLLRSETALAVSSAARPLLKHMSILFVPAVLGVVRYWDAIRQHWLALSVAVVVTTVLSLGIAAWIAQELLSHREQKR